MPDTREHVKPSPEQQFTWTLSSGQRPGFVFKDDNPWRRKYGTGHSRYSVRRGSYIDKKENKRSKNRNPRGTGLLIFGILSSDLDFAITLDKITWQSISRQYWHSLMFNIIFIEGLNHEHLLWSPVYGHVTACLFVHSTHALWRSPSLQTSIIDYYRNCFKEVNNWKFSRNTRFLDFSFTEYRGPVKSNK